MYSAGGIIPWHKKGIVGMVDESAMAVYNRMKPVTFEQHPFVLNVRGQTITNNMLGILRIEGDKAVLIGNTKERYKMLQPVEYISRFDEMVGKPCETLGFLGVNADKLFITWRLRAINVYGDIVELYGFISLGFDGKIGNRLYVTGLRVVCSNTHAMAISESTSTENCGFGADSQGAVVTTRHTDIAHLDKLGYWMKFVDRETERQTTMIQSLFCKMQETPLPLSAAHGFFSKVYAYPKEPRTYIPDELVETENSTYAEGKKNADQSRDMAMSLFEGRGIEIDKTVYGGYNVVTQIETRHRMAKRSDGIESMLIGARGKQMGVALRVAGEMVVVR
jgi:hypothetical protein